MATHSQRTCSPRDNPRLMEIDKTMTDSPLDMDRLLRKSHEINARMTTEFTDGLRIFLLTDQTNRNGMTHAEVVRVTEDGRRGGWRAGVWVWLSPDEVAALRPL